MRIGTHAGRPPTALQLRGESMLAIGVEISRPKSGVVLVDLNGETLRRERLLWTTGYRVFFSIRIGSAIREVAVRVASRHRILGVGVSLPGTIDKSVGRVLGAEALGWFDVEAGRLLSARINWPLFFENDANLSALAEQWYARSAMGIASLLRLRPNARRSGHGRRCRWTHPAWRVPQRARSSVTSCSIPMDGLVSCGNRGCWEQYASDAALIREYRELSGESGDALSC